MSARDLRKGRVLVLLTGGNIGLRASSDPQGSGLVSAQEDYIRELICGPGPGDSLLLREGSSSPVQVQVKFEDLRKDSKGRLLKPEELDSAQVQPERWAAIATVIRDRYSDFDGFVVLHGLDTMAYTASALSFMLGNLEVPVVFTGSQRPLDYKRTDAVQNIISAVTMAAADAIGVAPVIKEVTVYSYDTLFRANRASMVNASSYRTFDSPNFPPLANIGEHIEIQTHLLRNKDHLDTRDRRPLEVSLGHDKKVVILDVFPGMEASIISSIRSNPNIRGAVLRTYGMGTAPTAPEVLKALQELNEAGIVVMNVTQARSGKISYGQDPVSLRLFEQGVISGVDMTAEAALAKMVVFLSRGGVAKEIADELQIEHCGEQSQSIYNIHFGPGRTEHDDEYGECLSFQTPIVPAIHRKYIRDNMDKVNYVQFRLLGIEPTDEPTSKAKRHTRLAISMVDQDRQPKRDFPELKQDDLEWEAVSSPKKKEAESVLSGKQDLAATVGRTSLNRAFDITAARRFLLAQNESHPTTQIKIATYTPIKWKRASIAIFASASDREFPK